MKKGGAFSESSNATQHKGGKASGNVKRGGHKLANTHIKHKAKDKLAHKSHHIRNKHHGVGIGGDTEYNQGTASPDTHEDMYCCSADADHDGD